MATTIITVTRTCFHCAPNGFSYVTVNESHFKTEACYDRLPFMQKKQGQGTLLWFLVFFSISTDSKRHMRRRWIDTYSSAMV